MNFFHLHAHSEYSPLDGMPKVADMVEQAARYGQPGLALTDHGFMSGSLSLYRECKKHGILPFPGSEFYLVPDARDKESKRYHVGMVALNKAGYESLIRLSSLSHTRDRYHRKPRIDFSDLALLYDSGESRNIALLTGCYGGFVVQSFLQHGETGVRHAIETYTRWFPHTFIELQNHRAKRETPDLDDETVVELLWSLSQSMGVPVVVTQDAHYLKMTQKPLHNLMKQIAVPWLSDADAVFNGDSFHLARGSWMKSHYTDAQWEASEESMAELLMLNTLELPALDNYKFQVPNVVENAATELAKLCAAGLVERGLSGDRYTDRLAEELRVIGALGFDSYFLLVHDYVEWARLQKIMVNARGSASGSLVCYLLGITQLDPIEWGLLFERFLTEDRTKPPDIDLDVEDVHREDVIAYIRKRFYVRQIGTFSTLGVDEFGRGSVLVQYLSRKRRDLGDEFKEKYGQVKTLDDLEEGQALRALGEMRVRKAPGAHAAGFVVSADDQSIDEYIPTMLIPSSGHTVTQMTMDDVEAAGYVKIDVLGLRSLTTLKRTLEYLGRDPLEGLDWIPMNDESTLKEMRRGHTEAVFQFEGWAAQKGCREVKVQSTQDAINIMALYRPATMASGYTNQFLQNKRARGRGVKYPHPAFEGHLKRTYGVAIFQEQIMSILRDLGIPSSDLNQFLSALKMSNDKAVRAQEIFNVQRFKFHEHCANIPLDPDTIEEMWQYLSGFAGYGFNESHATAYGLLGYRAAYLKTHHPLEYMAAVLETTAGTPKESRYVKEARRLELKVLPPDVNRSGVNWKLDRGVPGGGLRRGLLSIKGVGMNAAEAIFESGPYESVEELIEKTPARVVTGGKTWPREEKGVLAKLKSAGALQSVGVSPFS